MGGIVTLSNFPWKASGDVRNARVQWRHGASKYWMKPERRDSRVVDSPSQESIDLNALLLQYEENDLRTMSEIA